MIFFSTSITPAIPSVKAGLSLNKNWRVWDKNSDKHSICSAGFIENFSISSSGSCGQEHGLTSKFYFSNFICLPTTDWTEDWHTRIPAHTWPFQTCSTSSRCCRCRPRPAWARTWSWAAPRLTVTPPPLWGGAEGGTTWTSHQTTGCRLSVGHPLLFLITSINWHNCRESFANISFQTFNLTTSILCIFSTIIKSYFMIHQFPKVPINQSC